jgi:TolB-like protein/DNA-binding SARP family transcriptional activator/Tfp pilus assembly protein PilF
MPGPVARISLLGKFEVEVAGAVIPSATWRKKRAVDVLTALALAPGHALHREELIDRFWAEKDLEAGANNLHRALYEVRQATAKAGIDIAILDRGVARLADNVWIDVDEFERLAASTEPESLARAIELYRGGLLPDDPYSDALAARREALRQRFADAALKLARQRHAAGHADECIAVLRRVLDSDNALEPAHQLLMEVLAKAGRQGDALRQFAECTAAVRARVDAQPSKATLELHAAIQRGELGPAPPAATPELDPDPPLSHGPSIAVLPFNNMSGDPEDEPFSDGISEDLITELSTIPDLLVIARNSTFVFKGKAVDVRAVGRKFGARHVLEGSVRKLGSRVRITAQLIDAASGGHVWADKFDRDLEDIFAVQDEVTDRIVKELAVKITTKTTEARLGLGAPRVKVNAEVYDLTMRARANHCKFSPVAAAEARSLLARAIEIDPNFAPAYAVFALVHCAEFVNGWVTDEGHVSVGMQYARKAMELDAEDAHAHQAVAMISLFRKDYEVAEREAEKAVACGPSYFGAHMCHGQVLDFTGRHAAAIDAFQRAHRLDPGSDLLVHLIGRAQYGAGLTADAAKSFERRILRAPRTDMSRAYLASIYGAEGKLEEARRLWSEIMTINPSFSLERLKRVLPYKDASWFERIASGLLVAIPTILG